MRMSAVYKSKSAIQDHFRSEVALPSLSLVFGLINLLIFRITNLEIQRKLHNKDHTAPVPGIFFAEYSFTRQELLPGEHELPESPVAVGVDGDDFGCFCGHVYCEAIDALDLDISHLVATKGGESDDDASKREGTGDAIEGSNSFGASSMPLVERNVAAFHTVMELSCPMYSSTKDKPFTWKTTEINGSACPHWNEGCSFPLDLETSDGLRPIKFTILNDDEEVGSNLVDIPLTPVTRIYMKRIFDAECTVRGYIVIRVGFVPLGFTLSDMVTETAMDEVATADYLGLRRKYAEVYPTGLLLESLDLTCIGHQFL